MCATAPRPRVSAEDRARVREIAPPVARAAGILLKCGRSRLSQEDLEAFGTLAVWRKLGDYDPSRAVFARWAFYQAFRAMIDVSRDEQKETLFGAALRRDVQGYVAQDDRPAERDFHNDTIDADVGRLRGRSRRMGASAWLQLVIDPGAAGALIEQLLAGAEAVRAVHEEVAKLSDEQRMYVRLRFWDEAEMQEAAQRLAIPERTLRRRWAETRDLLEKRLRGRGIFGVPEGFAEAVDALAAAEEARR